MSGDIFGEEVVEVQYWYLLSGGQSPQPRVIQPKMSAVKWRESAMEGLKGTHNPLTVM